jgi:hypothetical protein
VGVVEKVVPLLDFEPPKADGGLNEHLKSFLICRLKLSGEIVV